VSSQHFVGIVGNYVGAKNPRNPFDFWPFDLHSLLRNKTLKVRSDPLAIYTQSGSIIPPSKRLYDVIHCLPDLSYPISNGRLCHLAKEEHLRNIHGEEYGGFVNEFHAI